jgi:crotonobetainyl-CoA:carnitine CoA-transferase CaiB-like acyl-CoA transferase
MMEKLLKGLKVLDFTTVIAGPFITKILTAYGARVIKIESRARPGLFRQFGPYQDDILRPYNPWFNRGGGFGFWNTGKLSVALNLVHPKGVELAKKLVTWADVVVENFAGGVIKRMGLGYEELRKVKPDIIMLSSCMQGQTGPHANHPGYGTQLVNLAGFSNISGWPDREPANIGAYTDYLAPRFSVLAIMAALEYRCRTGKGQYIDLSQYEGGLHFMAPLILDKAVNHRVAYRMGNHSPTAAPHGAYPCRDRNQERWCAIAVYTDEEWKAFCRVIGVPAWTRDEKFSTLQARRQNEEELNNLIERWTINMSSEGVEERMREAEIPAEELRSRQEIIDYVKCVKGHSPYTAPHGAYRCRWEDRWCVIAVSTDEEWERFCSIIGSPAWSQDSRFASLEGRKENEEELDRLVAEWTINYTAEEVMSIMQAAGVAAGVVATGEDLMEHDPQLKHRQLFRELDHPEIGRYHGVTPAFILSKCPSEIERAPLMGEHNEHVLKEVLGITDEEIKELINEGIVE